MDITNSCSFNIKTNSTIFSRVGLLFAVFPSINMQRHIILNDLKM
jgi:hypothetical protein